MSRGQLRCWKEVCTPCACEEDFIVEVGEVVKYKLHFENWSSEPIVGTLTDILPEYLDSPDWGDGPVVTGGATWGYVGIADTETYIGHLMLPPGGTAVFCMTATVEDPGDVCPAVITNCAEFRISSRGVNEGNETRPVIDLPVCDYEYKYLVSPTLTIRNKDGDTGQLCFCPDFKNGRATDQEQMVWAFLGGKDECDAQFIMDCLENGVNLADLLRAYKGVAV